MDDLNTIYLRAIEFEQTYDIEMSKVCSCTDYSFMPRPVYLSEVIKRAFLPILRFFSRRYLFIIISLSSITVVKLLFGMIKAKNDIKILDDIAGKVIYVDTSTSQNLPFTKLSIDRRIAFRVNDDLSVDQILSLKDYFWILNKFIHLILHWPKSNINPLYLYSYANFAKMYLCLTKVGASEIVFSNQYDRWLVLCSSFKNSVMIQHGTVFMSSNKYIDIAMPATKTKFQVQKLYFFETNADKVFQTYLSVGEVIKFDLTSNLIKHVTDKSVVIIVVGGSDSQDFFERLILNLVDALDAHDPHIIYRPHPRSKKVNKLIDELCEVTAIDYECDIYVSYHSTLDEIYKKSYCNKVFYEWTDKNINQIVKQVLSYV
ncbi:hypothetical protein N9B16_04560 [Gammaproteobacteria bacterium]|nr:hypothetical protein [Gammaproteobacteria bacterium]